MAVGGEVPPVQWKRVFREGLRLFSTCPLLALGYIVLYLLAQLGALAAAQLVGEITGAVGQASGAAGGRSKLSATFFLWAGLGLALILMALPIRYIVGKMDGRMAKKMRVDLFDAVMRQPPGFFHAKNPGQLTMIINQFSVEAQMTLRQAILEPILQSVMIVATSGLLVYNFLSLESASEVRLLGIEIPVWLLLVLVLVLALCSPWCISLMGRRIRTSSSDLRDQGLGLAGLVNGTMQSPEEIQAMNAESFFSEKHGQSVDGYTKTRIRQSMVLEFVNLLNALPVWLIPASLLGLAVLVTIRASGTSDVGNLVAIFMLAPQLIAPIQSLSGYLVMVGSAWPGVYQVLDLMENAPPRREITSGGDPELEVPSLEVRDLHFSYQPDLPPVFSGLDFSLRPGTVTGLVARMGQGKTTFFRLALKFYAPQKGEILLGGKPLDDFSVSAVRRQIALMSQFPAFFHDTVRENLRLARPEASDEEILEICRQTGIDQVLKEKLGPNPLDAAFSAGQRLSGGQCKLFALTRCLLRDPQFVFLDEPTTGMDNAEKYSLVPQIKQATAGKTVVAVDHDIPWLLKFCDTILVLDGGRIVESGTGDELLAGEGIFADLHRHTQRLPST